ncbi:hypothetical protein STRAU_6588 [Streptomyces aurantiacus JA 4570]|uniref:Uncharacterized protein n=1 Tax=Streptomyces aurantiacus JA 4570 TaxID=1286094 RepID=S3ZPN1_9ACTN|nr:hypothetical protein STRAU_6588 [Streptomyces aurantiacus JA 4570]
MLDLSSTDRHEKLLGIVSEKLVRARANVRVRP